MPNRNFTEILLTYAIGPSRARAIVGDLLEMRRNRSRLWYWSAAIQTVVRLTWRLPAAFLLAGLIFVSFQPVVGRAMSPAIWLGMETHPYIARAIMWILRDLFFLAPFAAIKFGLNDRLFQQSLAMLLAGTALCLSFSIPSTMPALPALAVLAIALLFTSTKWRRAFLAMLLATAGSILVDLNLRNLAHLACWINEHKPLNASSHYRYFELGYAFPHTLFWAVTWAIWSADMLTMAFLCARLHRFFLRESQEQELA